MQMKDDAIVKISDVSFRYNGEPAISNINLEIKRGEFLGIIGPNGSGKTTLLKIMLGLLKPQKGYVQLFGQDINSFKDWSKIGYVPQKAGSDVTNFPISVEEVVGMGGADHETITNSLVKVEMAEHRKRLFR